MFDTKDLMQREFKDFLTFILGGVLIFLTWIFFFSWSPQALIPGHDGTLAYLFLSEFVKGGAEWQNLLYRPGWMGGVKLYQVAGIGWYYTIPARLGWPIQNLTNFLSILVQTIYAFLGVRSVMSLMKIWRGAGSQSEAEKGIDLPWGIRITLIWIFAFAPILSWRLYYGHTELAMGALLFVSVSACLLSVLAEGSVGIFLTLIAVVVSYSGFQTTMQQPILYGAVFGSPILFGLLCSGRSFFSVALRALLPSVAGLFLAMDGFSLLLQQATSGDSARSIGNDSIVYSFVRGHIRDWTSSVKWALTEFHSKHSRWDWHEVNYPVGPLFLSFLLFYPWKRFWKGGLGIVLSILLVIGFSNGFGPVANFILKFIPPMNAFRVPNRSALTFGLLLPIFGTASILAAFFPEVISPRRWGIKLRELALSGVFTGVLAVGLFWVAPQTRERFFIVMVVMLFLGRFAKARGLFKPYFNAFSKVGTAWLLVPLFGLSLGSLLAFKEREVPGIRPQENILKINELRGRILAQAPDLVSPLVRSRVDFSFPEFKKNTAFALGLSSLDGYIFPFGRFLRLVQALNLESYHPEANQLGFPVTQFEYKSLQTLYNIRYEVKGDSAPGGAVSVEPLPGAIGPAWFSEKLEPVQSYQELAWRLRAGAEDPDGIRKVGWVVAEDQKISSVPALRGAFDSCGSAKVLGLESKRFGQRMEIDVSSTDGASEGANCPLVLSMNYSHDLKAYAGPEGKSRELVVFPVYGALTGVLVPRSESRVVVEMQAHVPYWAYLVQGLGALLLAFLMWREREVVRTLGRSKLMSSGGLVNTSF